MRVTPQRLHGILVCFFSVLALPIWAQGQPRINALFPAGGQVGASVDVAIQGADLDDAHTLIIEGAPGITGTLFAAGGEVDRTHQSLFESSCTQCHELRSPSNRSMTASQWEATVDRMIRDKGAAIGAEDRDNIVAYLKSAARASGGLSARLTIAEDAVVGSREVRIVSRYGASTAWPFEVGHYTENIDTEPNDTVDNATSVELPLVINGAIASGGDEDFFRFDAAAGTRLVFDVKAYRLNSASQQFFNPTISLFDASGGELARSNGFYSIDPLIDHVVPSDGTYYVRIRDLLYRGGPAAIYRLTAGSLPYSTYLFPPGGQAGTTVEGVVGGENLAETTWPIDLADEHASGLKQIATPYGVFPFMVTDTPTTVELDSETTEVVAFNTSGHNDPEGEILFQTKCTQCHELRSPANRALTAEEWVSTITRMAGKQNSDISDYEANRITAFVQAEAERLGQLMTQQIASAQVIEIPGAVSGRISAPEQIDFYRFEVPEGKTLGPWWVIQPFDNPNETGFDTVYPPETETDLEKEYIGKGGRKLRWYQSNGTGNNAFSNVPEDDVVGYALTYYDSPEETVEILSLGSDDGVKVWVNDRLIFSRHVHRAIAPAQDVIALPLVKGRNKILIKIENGYGPWGFFATIGGYSIDLAAERLGSPLSPSLTLLDGSGNVLANNAGIGGRREAHIDFSFSAPGTHALRIEDITGKGGAGYIYHLRLFPSKPDFALRVTPDNPNIGRNNTVLLTVEATRRVGFTGEIALELLDLPPGVIASPGAILQDMTQGFITLTAQGDAALGHSVVQVVGAVKTISGETIRRPATPVEVYRIQNQPQAVQRSSIVVSVVDEAKMTLSVEPQHVTIAPGQEARLEITAHRQPGARQDVNLTIAGLPSGVRAQRQVTILRGRDTKTTLVLEPVIVGAGVTVRQNPFIGRELASRPYNIVVNASVGENVVTSSPAVQLSIAQEPTLAP